MQKLNKTILLALFMGIGIMSFQTIFAQDKKEEKQKIVIIEETTDQNGKKIVRKIVKQGAAISDEEIEKILKNVDQIGEDIDIIIEKDETNGEEIIIIQEIDELEDDHKEWEIWADEIHLEQQEKKPTLGVLLGDITDQGAEITKVIEDSGAAEAGLEAGDIIVAVDNQSIASYEDIVEALADKSIGEKVSIDYKRGEASYETKTELKNNDFGSEGFKLKKMKPKTKKFKKWKPGPDEKRASLGVMVQQEADQLIIEEVFKNSAADKAGLEAGDIIQAVNGKEINDYEQLVEAVATAAEGNGEMDIEIKRKAESIKTKAQIK